MKKQFNKEKEYLFISITSGSINPASSINIFFSIPPPPPPSPIFPSSIYHSLNYLVQRSTYHHSIIYPIPFPHSPFLSGSASTHLQLPSSLTSNFSARSHNPFPPPSPPPSLFLSQHTTSPPFLPRIPFISTSSSQSITPRRLLSSAFLPHTRPTSSPISLTSRPPLLPFQFSLHLSRHRLSGSFSNAPP